MKIFVDQLIPQLTLLLQSHGEIVEAPTTEIKNENLKTADALFVRSITQITLSLLQHTPIKFVATASAGRDNFAADLSKRQDTQYYNAPGSNALAVTDYVMSCIAALNVDLKKIKIGIVGVGQIGALLAETLTKLDANVLLNDPPRAQRDNTFHSFPLSTLADCDLISVHTPLTHSGEHATWQLLNAAFLNSLKPGTIIINAARGGVVDENALNALDLVFCGDTWQNEPTINPVTFARAKIKTPHIAGYSLGGKLRASLMVYLAFCDAFGFTPNHQRVRELEHEIAAHQIHLPLTANWQSELLNLYDPRRDSFEPANFRHARNSYGLRKEIVLFTK